MEDVKRRFANEIGAKLAAAPESDAKSEMIEELAENLAGRYADMTAADTGSDEAFQKALDELGSVDELLAYLAAQEPTGESPRNDGQAGRPGGAGLSQERGRRRSGGRRGTHPRGAGRHGEKHGERKGKGLRLVKRRL